MAKITVIPSDPSLFTSPNMANHVGISSSLRWSGHARAFKQRLSWDRWRGCWTAHKQKKKVHVHLCISYTDYIMYILVYKKYESKT